MEMVRKLIDHGAVPNYASIKTMVKAIERIKDNRVLQDFYVTSTRTKLCYSSGKLGHFANDPTCECYSQPRLYAIQEEEAGTSSQANPSIENPEDDPLLLQVVEDSDSDSEGE